MTIYALDSSPPYSALSYTWGGSGRSQAIKCDDRGLPITENLSKALRSFRHATEIRTFWVDAVCINQADIPERNSQIGLMKEIYHTAQDVVIWIGEDDEDTADGINLLKQVYAAALEGKLPDFSDMFFLEKKLEQAELPKYDSSMWKAVIDLYRRAWFSRIWVVQELAVARSAVVYCGRQSLPWSYFSNSAPCVHKAVTWNYFNSKLRFEYNRFRGMDSCRDSLQQGIQPPLLDCLSMARSNFSMDPRDKVFGILGLASDAKVLLPNPDYSTPVTEMYITLTKTMITSQRSLEVLSEIEDPRWSLIDKLPSWAVDWSAQPRAIPFRLLPFWANFHAASDSEVRLGRSTIPGTLVITGMTIDTVRRCGLPLLRMRPLNSPWLRGISLVGANTLRAVSVNCIAQARWQQWERIALKLRSYPNRPSVAEAYHRTLVAGARMLDSPHDVNFLYRAYLQASDFLRGPTAFVCGAEPAEEFCTHWRQYAENVESACHGRLFFITSNGYMGLAPLSTRSGDLICIFLGGRTPFVLRPDGKNTYKFIGECYVEGRMHGEAMVTVDGDDGNFEEFVLH